MARSPSLLQQFLEDRDVECPACGYNLRDLQTDRCPELSLRVGLVEPRQVASIAGLIGLDAGAGMNGLLLIYMAIRMTVFHERYWGVINRVSVLNLIGFVIEGTAILLWLRAWRRIRRLSSSGRYLLVAACWILTLVDLPVFSLFIK